MNVLHRYAPVIAGLTVWPAVLVGAALFVAGPTLVLPVLFSLTLFYGWAAFAFCHYRHGRQAELLHVVTTALEAQLPLPQALEAYVQDRPRGGLREFWLQVLLFFVFPGYYWAWH